MAIACFFLATFDIPAQILSDVLALCMGTVRGANAGSSLKRLTTTARACHSVSL